MSYAKYLTAFLFVFLIFSLTSSFAQETVNKEAFYNGGYSIPPLTDNKSYMPIDMPPLNYWLLETGLIRAVYSNQGTFGTGYISNPDCDGGICPSFETPQNSGLEYLYAGMVWIGGIVGDDTLVSVGADGWFSVRELWPDNEGWEFDGIGDYSVWTSFTDTVIDPMIIDYDPIDNRPHMPLNLRISNRAHVWNTDPEHNLIIYDMVVTNIGDEVINDGYIGFLFDADVYHEDGAFGGFQDDITGSLRDEGIGYIIDNDGDPSEGAFTYMSPTKAFAFKFLSTSFLPYDTAFNWWISNGNASLDFGPQPIDSFGNVECIFGAHIGTPTGDASKYCIMSHPAWDYDQITTTDSMPGWTYPRPDMAFDFANGYDTRFLMSIGSIDLSPDSSFRILFTTFTGDSVHNDPNNFSNNFGADPANSVFYSNLDFTDLVDNADAADLIVPMLINPDLPPVGLRIIYDSEDSVVVEWDPHGREGITGYNVYLHKVPADSMPYPDVVPPWLELGDLSVMHLVSYDDMYYRYTFDTLMPSHFYHASVANQKTGGTGQLCDPIVLRPGGRISGPGINQKYYFIQTGEQVTLDWTAPDEIDVDHYNIYKLAVDDTIPGLFYPLYDTGEFISQTAPIDSFYRNDTWYYYYAMVPYAQVDSGTTHFSDYCDDSTSYYITAVDKYDLESEFSEQLMVFVLGTYMPKDIVVINCRRGNMQTDRVECDSLEHFYDIALHLNYDRYYFPDTCDAYGGYKIDWWRDLIPYSLLIIDGGIGSDIISDSPFLPTAYDLEKYIHSGGKLAYFGCFSGLRGDQVAEPPGYYPLDYWWFVTEYFGVDSVFHMGIMYYYFNSDEPYIDTIASLAACQPQRPEIPYITFNPINNAIGALSEVWPEDCPPTPSTFSVNSTGRSIYRAEVMYPETSMIDNHTIGVKSNTSYGVTYLFGFHLWYMDPTEAGLLVDYLLADSPDIDYGCGDANGDGIVDVGDAVFLINYIFREGELPSPLISGDANGDGMTNVGDAVWLIGYIFRDGPPPACK